MKRKTKRHDHDAQSTIEFLFTVVLLALIMYALIALFGWVGKDLAERRIAHDTTLAGPIDEDWDTLDTTPGGGATLGTLNQLQDDFYNLSKMGLAFNQW